MQAIFQHHSAQAQTKNSIGEILKIQFSSFLDGTSSFDDQFADITNHILVSGKKDSRIDLFVNLISAYLVSFRDPIPAALIEQYKLTDEQQQQFHEYRSTFTTDFIKYIIECTKATNKTIRNRSIQVISEIMQLLNEECELRFGKEAFLFVHRLSL